MIKKKKKTSCKNSSTLNVCTTYDKHETNQSVTLCRRLTPFYVQEAATLCYTISLYGYEYLMGGVGMPKLNVSVFVHSRIHIVQSKSRAGSNKWDISVLRSLISEK